MSVRRTVATSAAVTIAAFAAPALASAESYHESRQDHLIHVVEGSFSPIKTSIATINKSITTLSSQVAGLNGAVSALSTAVTNLNSRTVPEYGVAYVAVAQGGASTGSTLPPLTSPQVPRDGGNGAVVNGTIEETCTSAPCAIFMRADIHSSRPAPAAGKSAGEIGGGINVTSASTGELIASANIKNDGNHGNTGLFNIKQTSLVDLAANDGTVVPFDSNGAILNGGATIDSLGGVDVPAGQYLLHGTFLFYDLDNVSAAGAARDHAAVDKGSQVRR